MRRQAHEIRIAVLHRLRAILLILAGALTAFGAITLLIRALSNWWDWRALVQSNLAPALFTAGLIGLLGSLLILYVRSYYHDRAVAWEVSQRDRVSIILVLLLLGSALYWLLLGAS